MVELDQPYQLERVGVRFSALVDKGGTLVQLDGTAPVSASGTYVFDGRKAGFDVGGHEFLSQLDSGKQRAVLEYLKTL